MEVPRRLAHIWNLFFKSSSTDLNYFLTKVCALLWLWVMDPKANSMEVFGRLFHVSTSWSTEPWPQSAHQQWAPYMVGYKEGCKVAFRQRKLETSSKQACAMESSTLRTPTSMDMSMKDTEVDSSADLARCLEHHILTSDVLTRLHVTLWLSPQVVSLNILVIIRLGALLPKCQYVTSREWERVVSRMGLMSHSAKWELPECGSSHLVKGICL